MSRYISGFAGYTSQSTGGAGYTSLMHNAAYVGCGVYLAKEQLGGRARPRICIRPKRLTTVVAGYTPPCMSCGLGMRFFCGTHVVFFCFVGEGSLSVGTSCRGSSLISRLGVSLNSGGFSTVSLLRGVASGGLPSVSLQGGAASPSFSALMGARLAVDDADGASC